MPHDQYPFTHDELRQFTGDLERFRHGLNRRVLYTPGVRHLAERAGAYWLIDEIAIALGAPGFRAAVAADPRVGELHFWRLDVDADKAALLTARADDGVPPWFVKNIPFTDFPLSNIDVWAGFDGEHWTLYLPSEH